MKRLPILVTVIALFLAPAASWAAEFGGGLRLGPTFSRFTGDDAGKSDLRTGFAIHVVGEIAANPIFAVQPELGYVVRGETRTFSFLGEEQQVETRLRYLELPVMLRVHIPVPVVTPYGEAGVFAAALLDADLLSDDGDREVNDSAHEFDYGIALGGGLLVDVKVISLMAGVRWTRGFNPVVDSTAMLGLELDDPEIYNSSVAVHVGVGF